MNPFARLPGQTFLRTADRLSDAELRELDDFLLSDATSDETMVLEVLDGYLTALVVGPATVMPSLWLPRVWGPADEDAPEFDTMEQAQRIIGLILKHMNSIIGSLEQGPGSHEPMMSTRIDPASGRECLDGEMWAHGFMDGVALCRGDWEPLLNDAAGNEALRPIRLLGADDLTTEEQSLIRTVVQRENLSQGIGASLLAIYRFWLPYRQAKQPVVRRGPAKVGRNDPCPCGSGRKFKHCCGTNRD